MKIMIWSILEIHFHIQKLLNFNFFFTSKFIEGDQVSFGNFYTGCRTGTDYCVVEGISSSSAPCAVLAYIIPAQQKYLMPHVLKFVKASLGPELFRHIINWNLFIGSLFSNYLRQKKYSHTYNNNSFLKCFDQQLV